VPASGDGSSTHRDAAPARDGRALPLAGAGSAHRASPGWAVAEVVAAAALARALARG
jgi:hypothetical protein